MERLATTDKREAYEKRIDWCVDLLSKRAAQKAARAAARTAQVESTSGTAEKEREDAKEQCASLLQSVDKLERSAELAAESTANAGKLDSNRSSLIPRKVEDDSFTSCYGKKKRPAVYASDIPKKPVLQLKTETELGGIETGKDPDSKKWIIVNGSKKQLAGPQSAPVLSLPRPI
jgi:hypothetical protein